MTGICKLNLKNNGTHVNYQSLNLNVSERDNVICITHKKKIAQLQKPVNTFVSSDQRHVCMFHGEIYDIDGSTEFSGQHCHETPLNRPAELILPFVSSGKTRLLRNINGSFVFVVFDLVSDKVFMGRDTFGTKVLYYADTPDGFFTSTNLALLLRSSGINVEIEKTSLIRYFSAGYILSPYTIYKNIFSLSPGDFITYSAGTIHKDSFSGIVTKNGNFRKTLNASENRLKNQFEEILYASIKRRIHDGSRDIAVYLSGGLDTSLICSILKKHTDKDIFAYTLGLKNSSNDETAYAIPVAKHLDINHTVYYLKGDDFLNAINKIPEIYGQPFADISAIPSYIIAQKVSAQHDRIFSGDGPDFFFGNFDLRWIFRYYQFMPHSFRTLISHIAEHVIKKHFPSWVSPNLDAAAILRMSNYYELYLKKFNFRQLGNFLTVPIDAIYPEEYFFIKDRTDFPLTERLLLADLVFYGMDDVLIKNIMSHNANHLDLITPFYDNHFFDFCLQLPAKFKFRKGRGKYLQRLLLSDFLLPHMVKRPKRGFIIDFAEFGLQHLRNLTDTYLTRKRVSETGLFNTQSVLTLVNDYFNGNRKLGPKLWTFLMFEMWRETYLK
ncbi:asparagine synthetase B family protein [Thermodesulfobacteriota bacterium]